MPCGCSKRNKTVVAGGVVLGYYVVRSDGSTVPNIDAGESPLLSMAEARVAAMRSGGGTIRTLNRGAAR